MLSDAAIPATTLAQFEAAREIFHIGGWVMWPLLVLSLVSVTLTAERAAFWLGQARASSAAGRAIAAALADRRLRDALREAERSPAVEHRFVRDALARRGDGPGSISPAALAELAERRRPAIERFNALLAAIAAVAPMLGILGTVTGIIESFRLLGEGGAISGGGPIDQPAVAAAIAEALYTTAFGLLVAIFTLVPHAAFMALANRALSRLETVGGLVFEAVRATNPPAEPEPTPAPPEDADA